jgi:DNA-binding GntR family transcriptional regulator
MRYAFADWTVVVPAQCLATATSRPDVPVPDLRRARGHACANSRLWQVTGAGMRHESPHHDGRRRPCWEVASRYNMYSIKYSREQSGMSADSFSGAPVAGLTRQQLPEEVAAYVRELIMTGAVRPGEFLRMERIAEAIGVSNTPVREGLLALSNQGFVRQIPRRGFVVAPFTQQDIRDLFWAQSILAGELAARAAKKITSEQLARLEQIEKEHDIAAKKKDVQALDKLGHAFHREINLAADSMRLSMLLAAVVKNLPQHFYSTIDGMVEASHKDHPLIIDALRKRHSSKAKRLMESHLYQGADRVIASLDKRGLWAASAQQ